MKIARYIDHAVLNPAMTPEEVRAAIQLGIDNDVYSVCVQPRDIEMALSMCKGTNTLVSCVLDFPHGCGGAASKRAAARLYAEMGVQEIDTVMNYGAAKGGDWVAVREEIFGVVEEAHARGVLVNVTGSMDIGLEEVETAANLVQQAANPDANIIFGATFDESLEDEIRVTVIATGFDKPAGSAAVDKPFTQAAERVKAEPAPESSAPVTAPVTESAAPVGSSAADDDDDPFDAIFNIFKERR